MFGVSTLYENESWTIGEGYKERLLAFEVWYCRRTLMLSFTENLTNGEVCRRADETRNF